MWARRRGAHAAAMTAFERASSLAPDTEQRAALALEAARSAWAAGHATRAQDLLDKAGAASDPIVLSDLARLRGHIEVNLGPRRSRTGSSSRRSGRCTPSTPTARWRPPSSPPSCAPTAPTAASAWPRARCPSTSDRRRPSHGVPEAPAGGDDTDRRRRPRRSGRGARPGLHRGWTRSRTARCCGTSATRRSSSATTRRSTASTTWPSPGLARPAPSPPWCTRWSDSASATTSAGDLAAARSAADEALSLAGSTGQPALTALPTRGSPCLRRSKGGPSTPTWCAAWTTSSPPTSWASSPAPSTTSAAGPGPRRRLRPGTLPVPSTTSTGSASRRCAGWSSWSASTPRCARGRPSRHGSGSRSWAPSPAPHDDRGRSPRWRTGAPPPRPRATDAADASVDALFQESLAIYDRTGRSWDAARVELAYGEWLRRVHRRVDARTHLRRGLETFQDVHAEHLVERAAGELRASGETARKRDVSTFVQLTPMELDDRPARRHRHVEQGGRRPVLGLAAHSCLPPAQRLHQGRDHLTRRARAPRPRLSRRRWLQPGHLTGASAARHDHCSTAGNNALRERGRPWPPRHPPPKGNASCPTPRTSPEPRTHARPATGHATGPRQHGTSHHGGRGRCWPSPSPRRSSSSSTSPW